MNDVFVYVVDFPIGAKANEAIMKCLDGYTILINARLSYEGQQRAYKHALRHIQRGDFERFNVQMIEAEAHAG